MRGASGRRLAIIILAPVLVAWAPRLSAQEKPAANRVFSTAFEHKLIEKPIGDVVAFAGKQFLGAPYEAGTLDRAAAESLICNLATFDCVTLVENSLALARCIKENRLSYDAYRDALLKIRYRNGILNGYGSRLHYFTEWIADNEKKGYVRDVTREAGGVPYEKTIHFMTAHRGSYPHLASDSAFALIKTAEASLASHQMYFIPKDAVKRASARIKNGDIIAVTTSIEGLDVSHTGIALRSGKGVVRLLHASDPGDSVRVSGTPLWEYLSKHPKQTGIMVARPVEPPAGN